VGLPRVLVRPLVKETWSRLSIPADRQVSVICQVWPAHSGSPLWLQRRRGSRWRTIARSKLMRSGSASAGYFIYTPGSRGRHVLRVVLPADAGHTKVIGRPRSVYAR